MAKKLSSKALASGLGRENVTITGGQRHFAHFGTAKPYWFAPADLVVYEQSTMFYSVTGTHEA